MATIKDKKLFNIIIWKMAHDIEGVIKFRPHYPYGERPEDCTREGYFVVDRIWLVYTYINKINLPCCSSALRYAATIAVQTFSPKKQKGENYKIKDIRDLLADIVKNYKGGFAYGNSYFFEETHKSYWV